jgi:hypothetical protein
LSKLVGRNGQSNQPPGTSTLLPPAAGVAECGG